MEKFKSREPIESVLKLNKNEDLEKLRMLLNELADLGWNSNQWSDMLPEDDDTRMLALHPDFKNWTSEERGDFLFGTDIELPKDFFIETFGHPTYGYMRAEGENLVSCAEKLIKGAKRRMECSHVWDYTHSNGHKTCKNCKAFVKCSVSEAMENYDAGNVKLNDHLTIYFNNKKTICSCGSNQVYSLENSMFFDTDYLCPACNSFLPTKFKSTKYSVLPVSPESEDYEQALLHSEVDSSMFNRQKIRTLSVVPENLLRRIINKYVIDMLKHYTFVLQKDDSISDFLKWFKPHFENVISSIKTQIKIDGQKRTFVNIENFEIKKTNKNNFVFHYDLITEIPEVEADDFTTQLKKIADAITGKHNKQK